MAGRDNYFKYLQWRLSGGILQTTWVQLSAEYTYKDRSDQWRSCFVWRQLYRCNKNATYVGHPDSTRLHPGRVSFLRHPPSPQTFVLGGPGETHNWITTYPRRRCTSPWAKHFVKTSAGMCSPLIFLIATRRLAAASWNQAPDIQAARLREAMALAAELSAKKWASIF